MIEIITIKELWKLYNNAHNSKKDSIDSEIFVKRKHFELHNLCYWKQKHLEIDDRPRFVFNWAIHFKCALCNFLAPTAGERDHYKRTRASCAKMPLIWREGKWVNWIWFSTSFLNATRNIYVGIENIKKKKWLSWKIPISLAIVVTTTKTHTFFFSLSFIISFNRDIKKIWAKLFAFLMQFMAS